MKGDDAQLHYRGLAPQPYIQHHDKETRLDYKSKAMHMPGFEVKTRMRMPWPGQGTHKKARLPQTAAERSAPLHTKKVTKLCYERLRKLAKGTPLEGKLDHVLRYNEQSGTYDQWCDCVQVHDRRRSPITLRSPITITLRSRSPKTAPKHAFSTDFFF